MNNLIEFLQHYSPLISLITFFIGLYVGNRQALWVDKRREFNQLAEPVIEYFCLMSSWYEKNTFTSALPLPETTISKLKRRMSARGERRLAALITQYKDCYDALNRAKERTPALYTDALAAAREIIKYIRLR